MRPVTRPLTRLFPLRPTRPRLAALLALTSCGLAASGCRSGVAPGEASAALLKAGAPSAKASASATRPPLSAPAALVRFEEVAAQSGLDYEWKITAKRPLNILQTIGNGCAFLDFDNDGSLDILLVGTKPALFRGDGRGRFRDVTQPSGLGGVSGHFLGCAVGDYDNDGWDDLYLSGYREGMLLRNEKGRAFRNATPPSMRPQPWGTSCAWADVDGDGRLDLFVSNYVHFAKAPGIPQLCDSHGVKVSCGPRFYKPLRGVFYRQGDGGFVEDNALLNVASTHGRGLALAFAPLDGSGRPSLALANDEVPGDLLAPRGKGGKPAYENIALKAGVAFDRDGNVHGGMGADWGDYDNDGLLDLFVTTYQGENKSLYRNEGGLSFADASYMTGLAVPSLPLVSFGCKWLDLDNDGWLDVAFASGHIQDNVREIDTSTSYRQKTMLFRNNGAPQPMFEDVGASAGPAFERTIVGRGLATGDYDNDGRVDLLIVDSEGKPLLLHNQARQAGNWAGVHLEGAGGRGGSSKGSNRDGQGALLSATIGGRKYLRLCTTGGSYLSASDKRVHFGLGKARRIDSLSIQWPSGRRQILKNIPAGRYTLVRESAGVR